ncbi:uncharacterized protein BXZ73DRAFT_49637 [Epithele typhae]|uniref:uncharacterized protein n=1 Tax=Epithele typhae TaxID=378194 RepID=UPI0020078D6C|nr:uncharacterized protein BXZ73DRAFT_49637 [Epithele typhae]KAH9925923.1 hypothetical protein BXZ73DRAFT_49637 [Epithele typhae]
MSLPPPNTKNNFLVHILDLPDAYAERMKHSPVHMEQNGPIMESGRLVAAGGILQSGARSSDADALQKVVGSWMVASAETEEEVWELLRKDIYYTSGEVWDHKKITVSATFVAIPSKA